MEKDIFTKIAKLFPLAALPLIILVGFSLLSNASAKPYQFVYAENGVWDLRNFDFENYNVRFGGYAAFIPNALLTPDEFAEREAEAVLGDPRQETFLTSRLIILVPDDGWYSFTRQAIFYSHRLYVNGDFLLEVGSPGDSRNADIPDRGRISFTVQPTYGVIEIVQHSSNFVHRIGGWHHIWAMGAGNAILDEARVMDFQDTIIMGGLFALFLILLPLSYILRGNNRGTLYCSLFCLVWFMRMGMTNGVVFTILAPWMSWHMKFRIEYIAVPIAAVLGIAIVSTLFPMVLNKIFVRCFYIFAVGLIALYLFADTVFMSHVKQMSFIVYGITIAVMVIFFVAKVRKINFSQGLFLVGLFLFVSSSVLDILTFAIVDVIPIPSLQFSGLAMLIFALCKATAVFIDTMREVDEAQEAKDAELHREMAVLNELITQVSSMTGSHQLGDIDARIEVAQFEGAHKAVALGVNEMVGDYVKHISDLGAVLGKFHAGDFNTPYDELPGKKIFLNKAVETLRKNLKNIDAEIETLSKAAVKGKLNARANPDSFEGDWKTLLIGLNNVMDAIVTPINESSNVLRIMTEGDLNIKVKGDYEGDFLLVKESINSMQSTVFSYVSEISEVLREMSAQNMDVSIDRYYVGDFFLIKDSLNMIIRIFNKILSEFDATASLVLEGARQMTDISINLSEGAVTQAITYGELNSAISEVESSSNNNAQAAQRTNELAQSAKNSAEEESIVMQRTLKAMEDINVASGNISRIIKVIEGISFQTNLLALNASVEAARAGEHGKGFSVVAEEVRNLAARSKIAASETAVLIEDSVKAASEGAQLTARTAEGLAHMVEQITEISDNVSSIAEASKAQIDSISRISQGISELNHVTQSNTALSQQGASSANELSIQAEMLKGTIEGFKLKED